jgi:hypothetical protein
MTWLGVDSWMLSERWIFLDLHIGSGGADLRSDQSGQSLRGFLLFSHHFPLFIGAVDPCPVLTTQH